MLRRICAADGFPTARGRAAGGMLDEFSGGGDTADTIGSLLSHLSRHTKTSLLSSWCGNKSLR
jgi:hypothetical protein